MSAQRFCCVHHRSSKQIFYWRHFIQVSWCLAYCVACVLVLFVRESASGSTRCRWGYLFKFSQSYSSFVTSPLSKLFGICFLRFFLLNISDCIGYLPVRITVIILLSGLRMRWCIKRRNWPWPVNDRSFVQIDNSYMPVLIISGSIDGDLRWAQLCVVHY